MKKTWSTIAGLPILSSEEERPLAQLSGVFMNPENGQIIGFLAGYTKVLVPVDIETWTQYAVKVASAESLSPLTEVLRFRDYGIKRCFLNTKRILSKSGKKLGTLRDFTFDTTADSLLNFEASRRFLWWEWGKFIFQRKDIQEVTDNSIRLSIEPEGKARASVKEVPVAV